MYFGANFPEMSDSEKLFCGIWTFLIVIVGHSFSLSCHFRFWRGKPGNPRVKPGDDIRGRVNLGMIPGEMFGTSPNMTINKRKHGNDNKRRKQGMTNKRKSEYGGKDG